MFKLLLLALVALCAALCQATPLQPVNGQLAEADDDHSLMTTDVLVEDDNLVGRSLLFRRFRKFHKYLKKARKGKKGKKGKKPKGKKCKGKKCKKGKGKKCKGKKCKKAKKNKKKPAKKDKKKPAKKDKKPAKKPAKKDKKPAKKEDKKPAPKPIVIKKKVIFDKKEPVFKATSSASCKAVAKAATFTDTREVIVEAAADVITEGCANGGKIEVKAAAEAFEFAANAVAQAFASSLTTCTTTGNAIGCAKAVSQAKAAASATGEAIADAFAIAQCPGDCLVLTSAQTAVSTQDWIDVYVSAEAKASTFVCAKGNAHVTAYEACFAEQIGGVFAEATAKAFIKAYQCYGDAEAIAVAEAEVETGIFTQDTEICKREAKVSFP